MNKVKVAVIGYGHLGKWHCQKAEALKDLAQFVGIVEKSSAGQEQARDNHPNVKVVSEVKDILNDIDAAVIVTPTSTHFELVKFLLENKKHVFCEKPLCSNDREIGELRTLAEKTNVVLQVGHSERFHEAWERLRPRFQKLVPPFTVRINRVAAFKGRATDVDVIQDLAIHDLDLLTFLFKQKPKKVMAFGHKIRTSKWDHANIYVQLEEDCDAFIVVGRNHVKEMRDLEVVSRDGMIYVDLFSNKIHEAHASQFSDGAYVKEETYPKRDHLLLEHQSFYQSILQGQPAVVGFQDGARAVHLVDCALKAIEDLSAVDVRDNE